MTNDAASVTYRAGSLTLGSPEAVVPLHGPGQWSLATSHSVTSHLICGAHSVVVTDTVRVPTHQLCQLAITIATGAPTSWTLQTLR
ncbi:MAG: hypothetical protein PXZ08_08620 [Actinomycetota bacterium]|nr:hypothetical protein [Actinomycetota bacterium]